MPKCGLTLAVALLWGSTAHAASIAGSVSNSSGTGLPGMEVTAWQRDTKDYLLRQTAFTNSSGAYTLGSLPAGEYKVYVRNGPTSAGEYAERWYATGSASGYVGADAPLLTLASSTAMTGINVVMQPAGGMDGVVNGPGGAMAGLTVRAEWASDYRVHHNDVTKSIPDRLGQYGMRGLPPASHRVMAWDLNAQYETAVAGPTNVTAGVVANGPPVTMTAMAADPREPNNQVQDMRSAVDASALRAVPPQPVTVTGSLIGPRNSGDVDLHCFDTLANDRLLLDARGEVTLQDNSTREHPYVDTVLGLFAYPPSFVGGFTPPSGTVLTRPDGLVRMAENDDVGNGSRGSYLDTGVLTQAGRYCVGITTYGDINYTGQNQGSAGRYSLRIRMGNRPVQLGAVYVVDATVTPGPDITLAEGSAFIANISFADPDMDTFTAAYELRDALGTVEAGGSLDTSGPTDAFFWATTFTTARRGPYALTITATDGEFTSTQTATLVVTAVNVPPDMPLQLVPADMGEVATPTPLLMCSAVEDLNEDVITYEFELLDELDGGMGGQTGSVVAADGGMDPVGWQTAPLAENGRFSWRVRAFDGNATNGYSMWTGLWHFFVNQQNDPPATPEIVKPLEGEEVMVRRPVISSSNVEDPEGDVVSLMFDLASDRQFTTDVVSSGPVPINMSGPTTMWTPPADLAWGASYFVRVRAEDSMGESSPSSAPVSFRIKANLLPLVAFGSPFDVECSDVSLPNGLQSLTITASDPEMEPVSVELQVFFFDDDPLTATPLSYQVHSGVMASTVFNFPQVTFMQGSQYRVRARASDGTDRSPWVQCSFTVRQPGSSSSSGGAGSSASSSSGGAQSSNSSSGGASSASTASSAASGSSSTAGSGPSSGGASGVSGGGDGSDDTQNSSCGCGSSRPHGTGRPWLAWVGLALGLGAVRRPRRR